MSNSAAPILNTCVISCSKNDVPCAIGKGGLYYYPGEKTFKLVDDHGVPVIDIWPPSVEEIKLIEADKRSMGRAVEETFRITGAERNGDTYTAYLQCNEPDAFQRTEEAIKTCQAEIGVRRKQEDYADALIRMLKSSLRVNLAEVGSLLATHGLPSDTENSIREIESLIASNKVEGMIDGNTFVNRFAFSTQGASYDIVVSFDFKDGILQIRCPSCAAAIPLKNKDPTGRCQYCGAAYLVPAKVLRLM